MNSSQFNSINIQSRMKHLMMPKMKRNGRNEELNVSDEISSLLHCLLSWLRVNNDRLSERDN
ncbi:CLUMA_CG007303, isoform A [Clunio marinus]|uniref:CLUMA_CG007303, isoform A n=1 Tax=Clunio marinus TaxID=568069 RepID=A0A1J1I095_9DIPT|nr:CLUMA_CG007303, isoform A [Clunio marinus]